MNVNYVEKFFVLNLIKLSGIMDVIKVEMVDILNLNVGERIWL